MKYTFDNGDRLCITYTNGDQDSVIVVGEVDENGFMLVATQYKEHDVRLINTRNLTEIVRIKNKEASKAP